MDVKDYISLGMFIVAVVSAVFSIRSSRQAREANERAALYQRPIFKVDEFYASQSAIVLKLRNINTGIATHVDVHIKGDEGFIIFKRPWLAGSYTGIAGKDETVSVYANMTWAVWESLGLTGSEIEVEFDTTAGEHMGQTLVLRQPRPKAPPTDGASA